ncbi:MAG: MFS transporter [Candidatus Hodarchaeales archaeon]|jgi:GPH family glycoside/pentoside/hexuronide:cation symporter
MTVAFILLFNPPIFLLNTLPNGTGEFFLITYLFVIISVFDALFTFVFVPIYALMPEIAPTGGERITLSVWGNIFAMLANVIGVVIAPMLYDSIGFSITSMILGVIVFICILAVLPIQESLRDEIEKQERVSLFDSLRISVQNQAYRIYLVNQIGMQFSFRVLSAVMPFFVVSVLLLNLEDTMVMTLPYIFFAILSFPFWGWITKKIGKKTAFIYSMALFSFPLLLSYLFLIFPGKSYLFLIFPGNIIVSTLMISLIGIGTGGLWIFPPTIVGDIVDDEERRLGLRRESMYYAFQEFTEKLAISLAIFLEGVILGFFVINEIQHPDYVGSGIYIPYYIYDPLGPILLLGGLALIPMLIALIVFFKFPEEIIVE